MRLMASTVKIAPSILAADVDLVLVMTVDPGFGGQPFNERSLDKITRVQEMLESARSEAELEVDGGIDPRTAEQVVAAGATVLVAGTAVFGAPEGVRAGIAAIRAAARRGQRLVLEGGQKKSPQS
jgi:ribulose-phosphate 3-epimerase